MMVRVIFKIFVSGVGMWFQDENPAAIPVYCLAHCVNLCLQEVARKVSSIKEGLNFAMEVIQLIKLSPKRQIIFETVRSQQESPAHQYIHSLCPTRWTVRTGAMQAIVANYKALYSAMEASSHGIDDCFRRASGVLAVMDRFSTSYCLF